ncbi:hypothetical protein [Reinekea sp. G2M2-21]|uniref:hypothetical protein n=1 Tax=Reinekea sp. G2M2-21 TaxID=2788942 RepID=UPI0018AB773D|nr:hypothetical protein [Reinekea sp. G2M2-21]
MSAISHVNDAIGHRHGFWADLIYLEGMDPKLAINEYIDDSNPKVSEIDLRIEMEQIEEYVFHNFLLGKDYEDSRETYFILEQFRWHIQEYVSLAAEHGSETNRWLYRVDTDSQSTAAVFVHIKEYVLVMNFHWRVENSAM